MKHFSLKIVSVLNLKTIHNYVKITFISLFNILNFFSIYAVAVFS